jgi:LysR family transcriptional regulator for metE and metH
LPHFADQTLLTCPVKAEQLDIFIHCLTPAQVTPKVIKHVKNSHVILQMVAAHMGIAVLPNWLVNTLALQSFVDVVPITANGLSKTLYMRYTKSDVSIDVIKTLLPRVQSAFQQLI